MSLVRKDYKIGILCVVIIFLIVGMVVAMMSLVNDEDGFIGYNESGEEYLQTENLEKNKIILNNNNKFDN